MHPSLGVPTRSSRSSSLIPRCRVLSPTPGSSSTLQAKRSRSMRLWSARAWLTSIFVGARLGASIASAKSNHSSPSAHSRGAFSCPVSEIESSLCEDDLRRLTGDYVPFLLTNDGQRYLESVIDPWSKLTGEQQSPTYSQFLSLAHDPHVSQLFPRPRIHDGIGISNDSWMMDSAASGMDLAPLKRVHG